MRVRKKKPPKGIIERILKDGSSVFVGRVQVNGIRHTLKNANMKELQKAMKKLKYELENNIYVEPAPKQVVKKITLNEWFDIWLEDYKSINVKQRTFKNYARQYRNHIKKDFGTKYIDEITVEQVQRFVNKLAKSGLSSNTVELIIVVFSDMLKHAYRSERIKKNPFNHVTKPKKQDAKEKNILSLEHEKILLKYCTIALYRNIFTIALYTGLRVGEILALTWNDIDFKAKLIHVRHTLVFENKNNYYLSSPKSKTSLRDVPMLSNVLELLKTIRPSEANANDFVFSRDGVPLKANALNSYLQTKVEKMQKEGIDIKHLSMHSFRHTFATRAANQGIPHQTLKQIMGHSSLEMTMNLYAHVENQTKQLHMTILENII